jgi:cobalt-zinc-cadmium efflux system membrane fusion protein
MRPARRLLAASSLVLLVLASAGCSGTPPPDSHGEGGEHARGPGSHVQHGVREEGVVKLSAEALARAGIKTAAVEERVLPIEIETTGQVGLDETRLAHVGPRIPGRVHSIRAELGHQVKTGEVLAEIDSIELGKAKAEYLRARAMEEPARRNVERERKLQADRISSEKEVQAADAELREATAALRVAEEILHLYGLDRSDVRGLRYEDRKASVFPLRSPLSGKVVEKHATVGELVSPEKNLYTIADLSRVWIWVDIYEKVLAHVHLEDDVEVRVDSFPDERFRGKVTYLTDRVDPDSRTVRARIEVDNADQKLRSGMFARVRVSDPHDTVGKPEAPALTVPADAVLRDGDESIVFVVLDQDRFVRRPVEIGHKGERWIEVRRGVARGDRVVVSGGFLLKSEASKETMGEGHSH